MPSQRESKIDDFAYDYLRNHYTARFSSKKILVDKAEKTKHGHEAQGLVSLIKPDNTLFVASLHTQHSPEIARMLLRYKKKGLSKWRFFSAFIVLAVVIAVALNAGHLLLALPLAIIMAAGSFLLHSLLERKNRVRKLAHLLDELKKTPADEQWLGISVSSLAFRHNYLAKQLMAMCKRRGVGIVTVGQRAKVVLMQEPTTVVCRQGDFLSHYESEQRVRKALLGDSYLRVA